MQLRGYQTAAIERARSVRRTGARRILLQSPTGSGKTVIAVALILRALELGDRVLVIAHRKELLDQFYVHLMRAGVQAGIMRGQDERTNPDAPVQLATIQTLVRRDLPAANLVIVDEAHRVPGESYARTLESYPTATILGLTATPCRLDGQPLAEHFDELVQVAGYSELIAIGSILAPICYGPKVAPDLSSVRKVAGEYHAGDLEGAMLDAHVVGDVVQTWLRLAEGRKTVLFAVGIEHSQTLVAEFQRAGVKAAHLDGETSEDERTRILVALETGELTLVSNCQVLCEGWDQPSVKACIMACPTLSLTKYMQCAGRILRPWGDKAPLFLDHSGNVERHGLPHSDRHWTLDGKAKQVSDVKVTVCKKCYAYIESYPCPLCGFEAPAAAPRVVKTAGGVLEKINAQVAKERAGDPKRVYFDQQAEKAKKKGFKPGFASAKYKEKYGDWPPWAWSQELKGQYDADWKARVAHREKERAYWQAKAPPEEAGYTPEPEDSFSGIDEL